MSSGAGLALIELSRSSAEEIDKAVLYISGAEYERICIALIRAGTQSKKADKIISLLIARDT